MGGSLCCGICTSYSAQSPVFGKCAVPESSGRDGMVECDCPACALFEEVVR